MPRHIEIIARGIHETDGHILLCRNKDAGYYYLPGGHIEIGEAAASALAREFLEETGMTARVGGHVLTAEVAFTRSNRVIHEVNLVFHVEQLTSSPPSTPTAAKMFHGELAVVASKEQGIDFAWMKTAELAGIDLRPACIREWLCSTPESRKRFISDVQDGTPGS